MSREPLRSYEGGADYQARSDAGKNRGGAGTRSMGRRNAFVPAVPATADVLLKLARIAEMSAF